VKRLAALAVAVAISGIAAGAAGAKEVKSVKVCGASGCKPLSTRFMLSMGGSNTVPGRIGPYYTVRMLMGEGGRSVGTFIVFWSRAEGAARAIEQWAFDGWARLPARQNAILRSATTGVTPFRPRLASVRVDGKLVSDPQSYIRLFAPYPAAYEAAPAGARWIDVNVTPTQPNPWISRPIRLRYQPERRMLEASDWTVVLPKEIGSRLVARRSLAASPSSGGGGHAALFAGVGAAGLAGIALLVFFGRRRRHH
jgi:hypothetical protein